jgi:hypothetical protein
MQGSVNNSSKTATLTTRLKAVEQELAALKAKIDDMASVRTVGSAPDDWRKFVGAFGDDPTFEEAVRLGREWRKRQAKC